MTQRVLHTITFLLLAIFLIGTVGVPVSKHICLISGHEDVAFFADQDFKGCCTDGGCAEPDTDEKASCCDDENQFFKLNIVKKNEEHQDTESAVPSIAIQSVLTSLVSAPALHNAGLITQSTNLPPPRSGTDILLAVQVFRL